MVFLLVVNGKNSLFSGLYRNSYVCTSVFVFSSFSQSIRRVDSGFVAAYRGKSVLLPLYLSVKRKISTCTV